jgi:endonuclease/exonuclease/phosphatase family metal-dependent hydrolase
MKLNKKAVLMFIATAEILSCCLNEGDGRDVFVFMSWNVQNLFDDVDNGSEYYEYDPANGEWNNDLFNRKAAAIAEVITAAVPGGPDIVLLQEVENDNALTLLNDGYLKPLGYHYSLFLPTQNSAIGCGVLSRIAIISVKSHAVNFRGKTAGRNISEIDFQIDGRGTGLKVFVNHWKSKLGGAAETEEARVASAGLLKSLIFDSAADVSEPLVIAAGDFNESHDEHLRVNREYSTAIMPRAEADRAADGVLSYVASAADMTGAVDGSLYNPWIDSDCKGSYCYDGIWETIDQFFLNAKAFDGEGLEYGRFKTAEFDFNTGPDGLPLRWLSLNGSGCSDHFPVILELKTIQ